MEFLLQLFADFIGEPPQEQKTVLEENKEKAELKSTETDPVQSKDVEDPVLFGLMQFH